MTNRQQALYNYLATIKEDQPIIDICGLLMAFHDDIGAAVTALKVQDSVDALALPEDRRVGGTWGSFTDAR